MWDGTDLKIMVRRCCMKKIYFFTLSVLSVGILLMVSMDALAQNAVKWKGSGGWEEGSKYSKMYDLKILETIKGEIAEVKLVSPLKGMPPGIEIILKTDSGMKTVQLGPLWYMEHQRVKLEPGDQVEVMGSSIKIDEKPIIMAVTVKKGKHTLRLWEKEGWPAWSGWRLQLSTAPLALQWSA